MSSLSVRVNEKTKRQAEEILGGLGMTLSTAVNIYLRQIVLTGGIPFPIVNPPARPEGPAEAE